MAKQFTDQPSLPSADAGDIIPLRDVSAGVDKRTTVAGLVAAVMTSVPDGSIPAEKLNFSSGIWWEEIGRTSTVLTGTGGNNNMEITLSKPCKYVKIIASGKLSGGSIYSWVRFNDVSSSSYDRSWMQTNASTGAVTGSSSQGTVATMGDADWDFYVEAEASAYRAGVVVYSGRMGSLRRTSNFGGYVSGGAATTVNKVRIGFDSTTVTQAELIILGHN
ncbi:hypothetical protein RCF27_09435 [Rhodococcus pyridinivorans]|uniref:hypothetical protein n=1 Tax=Rhodococcus pyridinivorans TaxID=103816 RepID=UPI00280BED08|nr:hypothetical protein [Rhodococcus pyridinivorans]WMM74480.1 hypothetical protein RCF27_09435 [Rhodococcus pyridinivorans]